jgi:uncharacterized RDD family membrane protein YckC
MVDLGSITLASFRRRANAIFLDSLIAFSPQLVVGVFAGYYSGPKQQIPSWVPSFTTAKWLAFAIFLAYMTAATYLSGGQTLGKRWQRIRVVPLFRSELTLWQCFERSLAYSASALELGFGFIQYFLHPNRQTVHDRIAETVVVNDAVSVQA